MRDPCVWLGRFQPFHVGHLEILRNGALQTARPQILGIVCYEGVADGAELAGKDSAHFNIFSPHERRTLASLSIADELPHTAVEILYVPYLPPAKWELVRAYLPPNPIFCSTTKDEVDIERYEAFGKMGRDRLLVHVDPSIVTSSSIRAELAAGGHWEQFICSAAQPYFSEIDGPARMRRSAPKLEKP